MRVPINEKKVSLLMKSKRVASGLSQDDVSRILGVSRATVNKQENHPLDLKLKDLITYADLYNCSANEFFMAL